jgi:pimeloyl-ACP methyl ester carboxylesterase
VKCSVFTGVVLLVLVTTTCAGDGNPALHPCEVTGVDGPVLCGRIPVLENRTAPDGRTIDLHVVVLSSRRRSASEAIYFLQGGPGAASSEMAPSLSRSPLREQHDLVLIDQRGTGGSNPLRCGPDDPLGGIVVIYTGEVSADLERCREEMDADLRYYTAVEAMKDLDEVRAALGHERINLWGASYGSLEALEYVRRHPTRVRTLALQGVAPPSVFSSLSVARNAQRALDATVAACRRNAECHEAFPDVTGELESVLAGLSEKPVEVSVHNPRTGEQATLVITRDLFAGVLRVLLYDRRLADRLPGVVRAAHNGEYDDLASLAVRFANLIGGSLYTGAVLSAFCSEDVYRYSEQQIRDASEATFLGPSLAINLKRSCEGWPRGQLPDDFHDPVSFEGPVLLLSGELDPVTPPSWADEAAAYLPNSLHVVLPAAGHFIGPAECVQGIMAQAFAGATVEGLDTSCARRTLSRNFEILVSRPARP